MVLRKIVFIVKFVAATCCVQTAVCGQGAERTNVSIFLLLLEIDSPKAKEGALDVSMNFS